jgi:N-acetylglucosaminyldiphosphoundecaprenol N-acetyl-beta-D-mannosaminyltransferase
MIMAPERENRLAITAPRVEILGVGVSAITMQHALDSIEGWIDRREQHYICVTTVHSIMECRRDEELRRIHAGAGLVTPDGMPLVWISRMRGQDHVERVYGPDLLLECAARAAERGWRFFFYGGETGVPEKLAARLKARYPGLIVAGTYSPPFRQLTPEEDAEVVDRINAADPDIVWVGLGAPKQDHWMAQHEGRVNASVMIGVGAAFDFHSGHKRQAPRWMQRSGLEWMFRLGAEPRRLWYRYLYHNPRFIWHVLNEGIALRQHATNGAHPGLAQAAPVTINRIPDMDPAIMPDLTLSTAVKAAAAQVSCDLAGETVILNLKDSIYYGLDEVGTCVWNLVQQQRTVAEVRDAILGIYDVAPDQCERDLMSLIEELESKGLVEIVHAEAA